MKVHRTNNVIAHLVDIVVADIQKEGCQLVAALKQSSE